MALIITYPSALEYWLEGDGIPYSILSRSLPAVAQSVNIGRWTFKKNETMKEISRLNFTLPTHIAIAAKRKRYFSDDIICHVLPEQLPSKSLIQISESIYIISPELCFLKAAQYLTFPELVLLGNQLCAAYVKDKYMDTGQAERKPITNSKKIYGYLQRAKNISGVKMARKAVKYVSDGALSLVEACLAVLAALPICLGGYGLKEFSLNYRIHLSPEGKQYFGRAVCVADIVWPKEKMALEYDSTFWHFNQERFFSDKKRATALALSGYAVVSVTEEQIKSFKKIEELFLTIRKKLGMKTRPSRINEYSDKRREVVETVMRAVFKNNFQK